MKRSLIAVSAVLLGTLATPHAVFADTDKKIAERCTATLYKKLRGKSATAILKASSSIFNYEYAAQRAASRNKENWKTLSNEKREGYKKKLRMIAERDVIPGLVAGLTQGTVVRAFRENGLLVIVYETARLKVNDACMVFDGSYAGAHISTLAAEALKENGK